MDDNRKQLITDFVNTLFIDKLPKPVDYDSALKYLPDGFIDEFNKMIDGVIRKYPDYLKADDYMGDIDDAVLYKMYDIYNKLGGEKIELQKPIQDIMDSGKKSRLLENKTIFTRKERKELAKKGMALPDGSFPIRNKQDLKDAIKAYGLAKNKDRAKKWIIKRAKDLNAEDLLPDSWTNKISESKENVLTVSLRYAKQAADIFDDIKGVDGVDKSSTDTYVSDDPEAIEELLDIFVENGIPREEIELS